MAATVVTTTMEAVMVAVMEEATAVVMVADTEAVVEVVVAVVLPLPLVTVERSEDKHNQSIARALQEGYL